MQIFQLILLFIIFTNVIAHISQGIAEENIQLDHQILIKENDVHKMKMQNNDQLTKTGQIDQKKKEIHQDDQGINTQKINQEKIHNVDHGIKTQNVDQGIKIQNVDQGIKTQNVDHGMNAQKDGLKIEIPHIDQETKTQEENEIAKTTKEADHMTKMKAPQEDTQQLANEIAKGLIKNDHCRAEQKKIIRKRENLQKQGEYFLKTAGVFALVKEANVWHKEEVKVANSEDKSPKKATMAKNKDALPVCAVNLTHRIEMEIEIKESDLLENLAELREKHHDFLKITDEETRKKLDKQEIEVDGELEKSVKDQKEECEKLGNAIANGLIWTKECKETAKKIIVENEKKLEMNVDNLIKYFHEAKKGMHEVKLENNAESTVKICPIYGLVYGKDNLKYWLEKMPIEAEEPELLEKSWTFIRHGVHGKKVLLEPIIKMLEKIKEEKIDLLIIKDATIKKDYKSMLKEKKPIKENQEKI